MQIISIKVETAQKRRMPEKSSVLRGETASSREVYTRTARE